MGEVDQAWLRLGAAKALQVSGCLGLPERESWVLFISCAFRLHLLLLPRIAPFQQLQKTQQPKSFLRATILHLAKELCHLLELHLDLAHLKPWESLPEQGACLQTCCFDPTTYREHASLSKLFFLSDRSTRKVFFFSCHMLTPLFLTGKKLPVSRGREELCQCHLAVPFPKDIGK